MPPSGALRAPGPPLLAPLVGGLRLRHRPPARPTVTLALTPALAPWDATSVGSQESPWRRRQRPTPGCRIRGRETGVGWTRPAMMVSRVGPHVPHEPSSSSRAFSTLECDSDRLTRRYRSRHGRRAGPCGASWGAPSDPAPGLRRRPEPVTPHSSGHVTSTSGEVQVPSCEHQPVKQVSPSHLVHSAPQLRKHSSAAPAPSPPAPPSAPNTTFAPQPESATRISVREIGAVWQA
jgi:hypothetical protein